MLQLFTSVREKSSLCSGTAPRLIYVSRISASDMVTHPRTVHVHPDWFEILYILSGSGRIVIGNQAYNVYKGNLLIYNQGVLHDELNDRNAELGVMSMGISDLAVPGLPKNWLIPENVVPVVDLGEDGAIVLSLWEWIFSMLYDDRPQCDAICDCLMHAILHMVMRNITDVAETNTLDGLSKQLCRDIRQYIDARYTEPITLQSIAESLNLSAYSLTHLFKKATGYTPMQYVTRRRIGQAQERLIHSNDSITDIAMDVGYNSLSSFNYAFSTQIGMSPSRFRGTYAHNQKERTQP